MVKNRRQLGLFLRGLDQSRGGGLVIYYDAAELGSEIGLRLRRDDDEMIDKMYNNMMNSTGLWEAGESGRMRMVCGVRRLVLVVEEEEVMYCHTP